MGPPVWPLVRQGGTRQLGLQRSRPCLWTKRSFSHLSRSWLSSLGPAGSEGQQRAAHDVSPTSSAAASEPSQSTIRKGWKGGLAAEHLLDEELPFDLTAVRRDLEDYIMSTNTRKSDCSQRCSSGDTAAQLRLLERLSLLTSACLKQLPAADLLLLLHVYSRFLRVAFPAGTTATIDRCNPTSVRRHAAGDADGYTAQVRAFVARGASAITRRPLDFLLHPQLTRKPLHSVGFLLIVAAALRTTGAACMVFAARRWGRKHLPELLLHQYGAFVRNPALLSVLTQSAVPASRPYTYLRRQR